MNLARRRASIARMPMKIALAQINPTVADVDGNLRRLREYVQRARQSGAELVAFPEQAILGYPARDLLLRRELVRRNVAALHDLAADARDIAIVVGYAEPNDAPHGRPLFNTAALLERGEVAARWRKRLLPTYDVFDEDRYFQPAARQSAYTFRGRRIGVTICEDVLSQEFVGRPLYTCDPVADLTGDGTELLINISASPYSINKYARWRHPRIAERARRHSIPILHVNQVGGNDDMLFDGASCAVDARGACVAQAPQFREHLLVVDLDRPDANERADLRSGAVELHDALVMGLRDYVHKCGFERVVIGISGGIDSAVTCALAAAALGPENVEGVAMPSRYSSGHSMEDARALTTNLGVRLRTIEIESIHAAFEKTLNPQFGDATSGTSVSAVEENIQARIRGALLMAMSNRFGTLLLSTGNKSELATGYCTLYGDMCGGLTVLSDVPKTLVYALARHINEQAGRELIPGRTIEKRPSAELKPDQYDQQALPDYATLDEIIERYEEQLQTREEIVEAGFDSSVVDDVLRRLHNSEYKRQQSAPGLKVTSKAFGPGRRMPIAARSSQRPIRAQQRSADG